MSADEAGVNPGPRPGPTAVPPPVPAAGRAGAAAPKQRPDPRPMRLVLGAGTIAAVSIMAAGLVRFPTTGDTSGDVIAADEAAADAPIIETLATARPEVRIKHRTVYVHLKRGQKPPKGAKVITGKAPPPRVVVTRVPGKAATTRTTRPARRRVVVTKTRQSGH